MKVYQATTINSVGQKFINKLLETQDKNGRYAPIGLYFTYDEKSNKYIGCDNSTGDAWVEEFDKLADCIVWLFGIEEEK